MACGKLDCAKLMDAFLCMALGENEQHERNTEGIYNHPHGWGIAYLDDGKLKAYKNQMPIWEDPKFREYRGISSNVVIIHARHSSGTPARYENTQPFFRKASGKEYVFTHNGSIKEVLEYDSEFYPLGETDSEMFFYYLLTWLKRGGPEQLTEGLDSLSDFSAANVILMDYPAAFINVQHRKEPLYYTMKLFRDDDSFMVASEALPGFDGPEWQPIENNTLIRLDLKSLDYRMERHGDL